MSTFAISPTQVRHLRTVRSVVSLFASAALLYIGADAIYTIYTGDSDTPQSILAIFVLGYFALIAVHELGHALMGRLLGLNFRRVNVRLFGVSVTMDGNRTNRQQFLVSIAGPLAHGALAGLFLLFSTLQPTGTDLQLLLFLLGLMGLVEMAFSMLLPIRRADGAKIIRTAYHCLRGRSASQFLP